ncbi:kinase A anchor protein [Obelidium mucronatum]|nr:kinase A anchor protein [Obelidium mucronatum]
MKPSHFISLRLNSEHFQEFAKHVEAKHETLSRHLVGPASHHVTLLVLALNKSNYSAALDCMDACANSVIPKWFPTPEHKLRLAFSGIGTFGNGRVVFAKVASDLDSSLPSGQDASTLATTSMDSNQLIGFAKDVQALFADYGLLGDTRYDFRPHVTLMKLGGSKSVSSSSSVNTSDAANNWNKQRGRGNEKRLQQPRILSSEETISPEVYLPFSRYNFGSHLVSCMELSAMGPMADDGYYRCVKQVDIPSKLETGPSQKIS